MKKKVYITTDDNYYENKIKILNRLHSLPFILEPEHWEFTNNIKKADVIAILSDHEHCNEQFNFINQNYNGQFIIILHIFHISEELNVNHIFDLYHPFFNNYNFTVIHTDMKSNEGIPYDISWNLVKSAYTDFNKYNLQYLQYIDDATSEMYKLNDIKKTGGLRKFLASNRIHSDEIMNDRSFKRIVLKYILENEDGYVNDPMRGIVFFPQEQTRYHKGLVKFGAFHPIHNIYYESSFCSIYVETLTYISKNNYKILQSITEKTWNPLIKGHFILPYGYPNMIQHIKEYGFILPDWIDYSYDNIDSNIERFQIYIKSVKEFLKYDIETLESLFNRDIEILKHNRSLFFTKPYDTLFNKIFEKNK